MEVVEAQVRIPARGSLKGRRSQRKPKSGASCVHSPDNTRSLLYGYIQPSFCDAFHCMALLLFRIFFLPRNKITRKVCFLGEWNRVSLESLVLKAIIQYHIFAKIIALSGEKKENVLFLEELKKIMRYTGFIN